MLATQVYEKCGNRVVYKGCLEPHRPSAHCARSNQKTFADEVMESGPEFTLPSRFAAVTKVAKRYLGWHEIRYPSSWKDRSWKRQARRNAQHRFGWPMPA